MRINGQATRSYAERLRRSCALLEQAETLIPGATQTMSKAVRQFAQGVTPVFLERGDGCHVIDVDGNTYLDYSMGLCALVLGYNAPAVTEAIQRQLARGISFSLPHPLEVEVAQRLIDVVPCAEMVRFAKNGSDATAGAVRLARAITGRQRVAVCGYHGAQDWYIGTTSRNAGVPPDVCALSHTFLYNHLESLAGLLAKFPGEFAAVMLEPVGVIPPQEGFLQGVVELAHRHRALVIFDEIVTAFRLRLGGAQELFGVVPDLACVGKGMANGMPLAAIVGRRELMRQFDRIFFSYTFGGETLSLAAAGATIDEMRAKNVIAHLWSVGAQLQDGCRQVIAEAGLSAQVSVLGYPPRHVLRFLDEQQQESLPLKTLFLQEAIQRGIFTAGAHNLSFAHTPADVTRTLSAYREAFAVLRQAVEAKDLKRFLHVDVVEPVFRNA